MTLLSNLLSAYRQGGQFPDYGQLRALEHLPGLERLRGWLDAYQQGAPFPSYAELAALMPAA